MILTQTSSDSQPRTVQGTQQFLDALGQGSGTLSFTFQTYDDCSERKNKRLARVLHGTLSQHHDQLTQLNQQGAGIYVTVNQTDLKGRKEANVIGLRALFVDFDGTVEPEHFHIEPSIIIQSKRGRHVYWLLKEGEDKNEFKQAQKSLAAYYGSDSSVNDLPRVMRLPGFYHMKESNDPFLTFVCAIHSGNVYTVNQVTNGLTQKQQGNATNPAMDYTDITRHLDLIQSASEGSRNITVFGQSKDVGKLVRGDSKQEETVRTKLIGAALMTGLSIEEATQTVDSGLKTGKAEHVRDAKQERIGSVGNARSNSKKLLNILRSDYSTRLGWDTYRDQLLMDSEPLSLVSLEMELVEQYDIDVHFDKLERYATDLAQQNPYNPVTAYLTDCYERFRSDDDTTTDLLGNAAFSLFGVSDSIYQTYLKKFAVSAVSRAFEPGCKVDTVLVLQGGQGYGKTAFFETLAGDYFDVWTRDTSEKDLYMKLRQSWLIEMGELDTLFSKRDVSQMKQLITTRTDKYRAPYARQVAEIPRHSLFCGTTNESEFLVDATGNRRFWVIPVNQQIDIAWMNEYRDVFWSEAVWLYKTGYQWWLDKDEQAEANVSNSLYEASDSWDADIERWSGLQHTFTISEVWKSCFGEESSKLDKKTEMRIAKSLTRLGYEKNRVRLGQTRVYQWVKK